MLKPLIAFASVSLGLSMLRPPAELKPAWRTADSLSVALGPSHLVPLDAESGAITVEPSVAIRDSTIVVSWNDSRGGHYKRGFYDVGSAISKDRGATFRSLGFLPALPESLSKYAGGGDSRIVVDSKGTFYLNILSSDGSRHEDLLYALRPQSYGAWQLVSTPVRGKEVTDKPALFMDADDNLSLALMVDWEVVYTRPSSGGASWLSPLHVSGTRRRVRSGEGVAACKSSLVVAWMEGGGNNLDEVWLATSSDRGRSFSDPRLLFGMTRVVSAPRGYALGPGKSAEIGNDVAVACAPSKWKRQGVELFTVDGYRDSTNKPASRILVFHDPQRHGSSASDLTSVDGDALRVFPSVAATETVLGILYYELRPEASRTPAEVIVRLQDEAGRLARVRLSESPTDWMTIKGDLEFAPGQHNVGDYISLASDGKQFVAAWTEGVDGRSRIKVRTISVTGMP